MDVKYEQSVLLTSHPHIEDEIAAATAQLEASEADIVRRTQELEAASQRIQHLQQLKRLADADAKMKAAQAKIQKLEEERHNVAGDMLSASQQLEALREELYEVPLQQLTGAKAAEISELQVEAYLERHRVDALMEDMLASVIQHMPSYPEPFLINLLKRKTGSTIPDANNVAPKVDAQALQTENAALRQEIVALKNSNGTLQQALDELTERHTRLQQTCAGHEADLAHTKARASAVQANDDDIENFRQQLSTATMEIRTLTGKLESEEQANARLRSSLQTATQQLDDVDALTRQVRTLKLDNEDLSTRLQRQETTLTASLADTEAQLKRVHASEIASLQSTVERKDAALKRQEATIADLESALPLARQDSANYSDSRMESLQQQLNDTRKQLEAAEAFKTTTMQDLNRQLQEATAEQHRLQTEAFQATEQAARADAAAATAMQEVQATIAAAPTRQTMNLSQVFADKGLVYTLLVRTGDVKNAGTDAKVFVQLFGDNGQTDRIPLATSAGHKNKFERGRTDTFTFEGADVGDITHIRIGHDGRGLFAGWYLDKVTVQVPSLGVQYVCVADRWLASDLGDGKIEIDVTAQAEATQLTSSYVCRTYTGGKSGATLEHASVYVMLYGAEGKSEELLLQNDDKSNFNEKGKVDEFRLETASVGDISKIRLWHDNKGAFGASWFVDRVEVHDLKQDVVYKFTADRWLSKNHGDKTIVAELPVSEKVLSDGTVEAGPGDKTTYEVAVKTGNVRNAGTDANVFCTIVGTNGDTGERALTRSKNHRMNKFERNHTDLFDLEAVDLGDLTRLKIWHDNKGLLGGDWFLDSVTVKCAGNADVVFPCNAWLSQGQGLVKELSPQTTDVEGFQVEKAAGVDYLVKVVTSDVKDASTDAEVYLILYGESQDTGKIALLKSKDHKDKFQRGQEDNFVINAVNIGDITKIKIGHNNKRGMGLLTNPSWHLDRVEVDAPSLGKKFTFAANRWLATGKDDGMLEVTLFPAAGGASHAVETYKAKKTWEVVVTTSDIKYAGTDAHVHMVVYSKSPSGEDFSETIAFDEQETKDSFERSKVDHFRFDLEDAGEPYKIRVGHDDSGWGADWHLESVAFLDPVAKVRYLFQVNDWIKEKNQIEAPLSSKSALNDDMEVEQDTTVALEAIALGTYTVTVVTGTDKGASTDANILLTMFGENGDSGAKPLLKSSTNKDKFESGKTDVFELANISKLGALKKIKLQSDNKKGLKLFSPNWQVASVTIEDPDGGIFSFDCNGAWLSKEKGLEQEFSERNAQTTARQPPRSAGGPVPPGRAPRTSSSVTSSRNSSRASSRGASPTALRRLSQTSTASSRAKASPRGSRSSLSRASATADVAAALEASKRSSKREKLTYQVSVTTGTAKNAGTDANISIEFTGTKGSSGAIELAKSKTNKDKFEAGKTDVFDAGSMSDLGTLKSITLTRDTKRGMHVMHPQWLVDRVKISASDGRTWTFTCGAWLSKKEGLSKEFSVDDDDDDETDDMDDEFMRSSAMATSNRGKR